MKTCLTFLMLMVVTLAPGAVAAGPNVAHLTWGSQLNPSDCPDDQGYRYLEMNVTQHVTRDADQALRVVESERPRYWASLDYNRHIQVWKIGVQAVERYCALVHYQGSWKTIAGGSPADPMTHISAGIEGTFQGGYRAVIEGQLNESERLRGRLLADDRAWTGMDPFAAPNLDNWIDTYFPPMTRTSVETVWWGWIYHGGPNSTFVHACDVGVECPGSSGNITD